jgi:succinoglycan biosynthesis transport protein ExoP
MLDTDRSAYDALIVHFVPSIRRRWKLIFSTVVAAGLISGGCYYFVGPRYEAYILLRVGQGIKDQIPGSVSNPFDGIDLASRIDSVARIGMTDYVIRQAAEQVGFQRFTPRAQATLGGDAATLVTDFVRRMPAMLHFPSSSKQPPQTDDSSTRSQPVSNTRVHDPKSTIIGNLREDLTAKQEGRSDILRISFRASDPSLAAEFLNSLGIMLVANYADVIQVPGAESFFRQQTTRLEREAERAAAEVQAFSVSAQIYSVVDQRTLLLKRLNDLTSQLTAVRGSLVEKKGFKQALMDELMLLRPVYQSKTVTGIVKSLGGPNYTPNKEIVADASANYGELPPILLVKVYQDNMAALMKVNADLVGLTDFVDSLGAEIARVNDELVTLASKEAEYNRLRGVLTRATAAAENYGSRAIEEQIKSDIAKRAQLSSVRVVQEAEIPIGAVFPNDWQLILLTLILGAGFGATIAVMLELAALRSAGRNLFNERGQVVAHIGTRYLRRDEMLGSAE